MRVSAALPVGVAALFFEAAERRREVEGRLVSHLEAAGYREVILPILDYLEPYEPLLAPASRSQLYRFLDRGGETLALRADFTPMLARLLAPRLASLELPLRLYYRGDVVRHQEEKAGQLNEFYQLGAELVGAPGEAADAEMLRLVLTCLDAAPSPQLVLGFAGALDELLLAAGGDDPGVLAEQIARRERGAARRASWALFEVVETGQPAEPAELGHLAAERLAALRQLAAELAAAFPAVALTIDLAELARYPLDPRLATATGAQGYYDGLVFRAYAGRRGLQVGAGGRYDSLFARLGAAVPAVGFSLGLDRLSEALREAGG